MPRPPKQEDGHRDRRSGSEIIPVAAFIRRGPQTNPAPKAGMNVRRRPGGRASRLVIVNEDVHFLDP